LFQWEKKRGEVILGNESPPVLQWKKNFALIIMCLSNLPSLIGEYLLSKKMQFKNEVILEIFNCQK
jgi:hypothetical protein